MKTLSEQIQSAQDELVTLKDKLVEATKALETEANDANEGAVVELTASVEKTAARLESLQRAEKALGTAVAKSADAPVIVKSLTKSADVDNLYGKLAACTYEAKIKSLPIEAVIDARFAGNEALKTVVKAAQNPAMSNVSGYASELTQIGYGQVMDLLRAESILPRCVPAMQQHQFNGYVSITVPFRAGSSVQSAGSFRAEGAAIPVQGLTFDSLQLTPKNLGVILTATAEMLRRSSVDLASYFQGAIVKDTGEALDNLFISATAGSSIAPAGIRNGVTGGDTRDASGTGTTADIVKDLRVMMAAMAAANMGGSATTKWLMHPTNYFSLMTAITATGASQFPTVGANGTLYGMQIVTSTLMAANVVLLVDFQHITCAFGAPAFEASTVATIHEDTAATAISAVGTPNVVAAPVRSLYQTNSWALRMLLDADWAKLRTGGLVQQLTNVAWAP